MNRLMSFMLLLVVLLPLAAYTKGDFSENNSQASCNSQAGYSIPGSNNYANGGMRRIDATNGCDPSDCIDEVSPTCAYLNMDYHPRRCNGNWERCQDQSIQSFGNQHNVGTCSTFSHYWNSRNT